MENYYNYHNNTHEAAKPPNIFRSFLYALIPTKYDQLIKVKTGSMIGFVFLLVLIATLARMTVFGIRYNGEFDEGFPDILIRDGRLFIEEDYMLDERTRYLLVTDKVDGFSYEDVMELADAGYNQIWLVGRDKITVMQHTNCRELYFADVVGYGEEIRVKEVVRVILYIAVALVTVIFFVCGVLWYFLCSAVLLVIGLIIAQMFKRDLSAGQVFRIAVYSRVLVYVVATFVIVCSFMHFAIPNFFRVFLTVLFLIAAIRFIPQPNKNPMGGTGNLYGPMSY